MLCDLLRLLSWHIAKQIPSSLTATSTASGAACISKLTCSRKYPVNCEQTASGQLRLQAGSYPRTMHKVAKTHHCKKTTHNLNHILHYVGALEHLILTIHTCSLNTLQSVRISPEKQCCHDSVNTAWPGSSMCIRNWRGSRRINNDIACQVPEGPSSLEADAEKTKPRDAKESQRDNKSHVSVPHLHALRSCSLLRSHRPAMHQSPFRIHFDSTTGGI